MIFVMLLDTLVVIDRKIGPYIRYTSAILMISASSGVDLLRHCVSFGKS